MKFNENYLKLKESYLFSDIARRVNAYAAAHPDKKILRMGIGDVTLPLAPAVIEAMQKAVAEMGDKATFRGYGPEQGYDFLREAVRADYARRTSPPTRSSSPTAPRATSATSSTCSTYPTPCSSPTPSTPCTSTPT